MAARLRRWLSDTQTLPITLFLLGSFIGIGGIVVVRRIMGVVPDMWLRTILVVSIPWIIVSNLIVAIRQEAPRLGMRSVKGTWAVVQGIVGVLVFGAAEVYLLILWAQEGF